MTKAALNLKDKKQSVSTKSDVVSSKSSRKKKGKVGKAARVLKNRESKLVENAKKMLFLRGSTASSTVQSVLKDLVR